MKPDKQSDNEQDILAGCLREERWAQRKLYELYAPAMMSLCVRYTGDRATAQDVLQDGFIKLFAKIDSYAGTGSLGGWIRRVFVTTALEYLRQKDVLRQSDSIDDYLFAFENNEVTVLDRLSAEELLKLIAELPPGYRAVFNLYAIEGYSHAEIAQMLQMDENTSRSQFMRARRQLQQRIQELINYHHARRQEKYK